jgi:hypothetical protein
VFADPEQLQQQHCWQQQQQQQQQLQQQLYKVCPWGAALARSPLQLQLLQQLGKSNKPYSTAAAYNASSTQDHSMWLLQYGPNEPGTPLSLSNMLQRCCCL